MRAGGQAGWRVGVRARVRPVQHGASLLRQAFHSAMQLPPAGLAGTAGGGTAAAGLAGGAAGAAFAGFLHAFQCFVPWHVRPPQHAAGLLRQAFHSAMQLPPLPGGVAAGGGTGGGSGAGIGTSVVWTSGTAGGGGAGSGGVAGAGGDAGAVGGRRAGAEFPPPLPLHFAVSGSIS